MQARRGMAWLLAALWLAVMLCIPLSGWASGSSGNWLIPQYVADIQSSMGVQMLGEKAAPPPRPGLPLVPEVPPSLRLDSGSSSLKLPYNLEMNISVLYHRDPTPLEPPRLSESPLLMKYSMDYRLLPNLQVGLNGYLYRPSEDSFALARRPGSRLGFGPQLKYNLGRWSFLLKGQVETGDRDRGDDLQNWFRVWYAF